MRNLDAQRSLTEEQGPPTSRAPRARKVLTAVSALAIALLFGMPREVNAQTDVLDHGGSIMQEPMLIYLIFWLPNGFVYDSAANLNPAGIGNYEAVIERFFTDISQSNYFNTLTQYPGTCGPNVPTQQSCFGTVRLYAQFLEDQPYPHAGTQTDPLQDSDIQTEIQNIMTRSRVPPGLNAEFFVFTGAGVQECASFGCTFSGSGVAFCAYHSSFNDVNGNTVIYSYMPDLNSLGSGCSENISTSPNGQISTDREIVGISHEFFESVSDPLVNQWFDDSSGNEIGDNCNQQVGTVGPDGSNVSLNGHPYVVQQIWSNRDDSCIVSFHNFSSHNYSWPTIENIVVTGNGALDASSTVAGVVYSQEGGLDELLWKELGQPSWNAGSMRVLVFPYGLPLRSPPVKEVIDLVSYPAGANGPWPIQYLDVKLRNPNGSLICEQVGNGNPLASITDGSPYIFPTPNCVSPPPTWSERGPAVGGRLSAIVVADAGRNVLAASPGGGVWHSTDGGATWAFPAQHGLGDNSAVHLEWDAATPGRLFLLTWNGLYATTNNGYSWTNLINPGGFPAPLQAYQVAIADPRPFVQMLFSPAQRAVLAAIPCSGLYYSFDGITFTQHWPFPGGSGNPDNCIGTIAADPFSGRVYFSTFAIDPFGAAHVYRSNCAPPAIWGPGTPCLTWQAANNGLPSNSIVSALTSVATSGSADHLVTQIVGSGSSLSTYLTTDGLSWTLQSTQPNGWAPRALVYTGHGQELFQGNVLASYSGDFGAHWANFTVPSEHPDVRAVYPDTAAGKVWTVTDGSEEGSYANVTQWNWTPGSPPAAGINLGHSGLTVWQAYFAGVVPATGTANSRRVFVGSQDNDSLCSDSLGLSGWTSSGAPPGGGSGDIFAFASAPSDSNRAYSWSGETVSFARTMNAASASNCAAVAWSNVTPSQNPTAAQMTLPQYWSYHALAVHPTNADRLYFAFSSDVGETTNASAPTPLVTHHSLPNNRRPTAIYVDASGAIYLGTAGQGAYKSTDDGLSWSAWGPGISPAPALVTAITSSGGMAPTFWIATTSGLYKGSAGGGPWTLATGGGGYTVSDVAVDPSCATRVYAAFGFAGILGEHWGGIQFSSNNGASWSSITAGQVIHQGPVSMVQVDQSQPTTVYAATYGRGFWIYNWGNQLPACAP